jgi:hypothetical protein
MIVEIKTNARAQHGELLFLYMTRLFNRYIQMRKQLQYFLYIGVAGTGLKVVVQVIYNVC